MYGTTVETVRLFLQYIIFLVCLCVGVRRVEFEFEFEWGGPHIYICMCMCFSLPYMTTSRATLEKRVLHPGASTSQIIDLYIATVKALRVVDPEEALLVRMIVLVLLLLLLLHPPFHNHYPAGYPEVVAVMLYTISCCGTPRASAGPNPNPNPNILLRYYFCRMRSLHQCVVIFVNAAILSGI